MLILKTLLFTILAPCTLTLLVPYTLLSSRRELMPPQWGVANYAGSVLAATGVAIYLWCAWDFIKKGRGTPAPYDPPKELVVSGLYRYTRNPIYVGVTGIVVGEAVFFKAVALLVYAGVLLVGFHLRVVYYEEPTLKRLFGDSWERYKARVHRWLPVAKSRDS